MKQNSALNVITNPDPIGRYIVAAKMLNPIVVLYIIQVAIGKVYGWTRTHIFANYTSGPADLDDGCKEAAK